MTELAEFTALERSILETVCRSGGRQLSKDQRGSLQTFLATAKLVERENTGHGFYTTFQVDRASAPALENLSMIDAPTALMVGLGEGNSLGFILWAQEGYPTTLEGFQNGDDRGQTVDLRAFDLRALRSISLTWT